MRRRLNLRRPLTTNDRRFSTFLDACNVTRPENGVTTLPGTDRPGRASLEIVPSDVPMPLRHGAKVQPRDTIPAGFYNFCGTQFASSVITLVQ